jgi:preprotein translocase subunit SecD
MNKKRQWKPILTGIVVLLAIVYTLPSLGLGKVFPESWKRLSYGLDLQGGLELRYTVDVKRAIGDNTWKVANLFRDRLIAQQLGKIEDLDAVDPKEMERLRKLVTFERIDYTTVRLTLGDELKPVIKSVGTSFIEQWVDSKFDVGTTTDNTIELVLRYDEGKRLKDEIVAQTLDIIRKRISAFGLVEPDVRRAGESDIDVQLPGVEKSKMNLVRGMIGQTAQLTFRLVSSDANPISGLGGDLATYKAENQGKAITLEIKDGNLTAQRKSELLSFLRWVDEKRVKNGQGPLVSDDNMIGFQELTETQGQSEVSKGWSTVHVVRNMRVGKGTGNERGVTIGGDQITRAMVNYDENGIPYASIDFDGQGAEDFGALTTENVQRNLAIMLDDEVKSAPNIKEPITGGRCRIDLGRTAGRDAVREAQALVTVLTTGAYRAPVHKVHDHSVGPSLGQASIDKGVLAAAVGTLGVVIFMVFIYRMAGVIAMVGVVVNIILLLAMLISFNATLTLPGIAGIVLTIGMAVDANVLINERIREELRSGKSFRAALELGYDRAFWTIFDSNLTTALAGFIMLVFTTGPIYGFAVTLIAGIVSTMFTAVVVTRMVFHWLVHSKKFDYVSI